MKAIHRILLFIVVAAQLTSCGLLNYDVDEEGVTTPASMSVPDTIYVMCGDTFSLNPVFSPDTINIKDIFILPENSEVVAVRGSDKLEAVGEGATKIYIVSVSARIQDSCMVYVSTPWEPRLSVWPYETVFYAHVTVGGQPLAEGMEVAAFVGGECRAIGQVMTSLGITYTRFRVGSDILYTDDYWDDDEDDDEDDGEGTTGQESTLPIINFRCYDRPHRRLYTTATYGVFDGEAHGSLSELFEIAFK